MKKILSDSGFAIEILVPIGDYYSWLAVEMVRTITANSVLSKLLLFPALLYFYNKKKTELSVNTLCMGYHVVARKISVEL